MTLHLGGGRTGVGSVADGSGFDVYALRTSHAPWYATGLSIRRPARDIRSRACNRTTACRVATSFLVRRWMRSARSRISHAQATSRSHRCTSATATAKVCPTRRSSTTTTHGACAIDLNACIGCNACTIACQAENNIPVVGKDAGRSGREMHWIRVDRYLTGPPANPHSDFQPVPCMQCEHAPCEIVCPVGATVHDTEGLNVQVYNRCIGTRFCSNNCPYKVRRFNFLQYTDDEPSLNAQRNPEVTVRDRGVMEKCNYCCSASYVRESSRIAKTGCCSDGEVVTACQAVCPTAGDHVRRSRRSPIAPCVGAKASPRNYALLRELNTRPRTTYLAKVVNRDDEGGPT